MRNLSPDNGGDYGRILHFADRALDSAVRAVRPEFREIAEVYATDPDLSTKQKIEFILRFKEPGPEQEWGVHEEREAQIGLEEAATWEAYGLMKKYPEAYQKDLQPELLEQAEIENLARAARLRAEVAARREESYPEAFIQNQDSEADSQNAMPVQVEPTSPRRPAKLPKQRTGEVHSHGTRGFKLARLSAAERSNRNPDGLEDGLAIAGRRHVRRNLRRLFGNSEGSILVYFD